MTNNVRLVVLGVSGYSGVVAMARPLLRGVVVVGSVEAELPPWRPPHPSVVEQTQAEQWTKQPATNARLSFFVAAAFE